MYLNPSSSTGAWNVTLLISSTALCICAMVPKIAQSSGANWTLLVFGSGLFVAASATMLSRFQLNPSRFEMNAKYPNGLPRIIPEVADKPAGQWEGSAVAAAMSSVEKKRLRTIVSDEKEVSPVELGGEDDPVLAVRSRTGEDCHSACRRSNLICYEGGFYVVNECETVKSLMHCEKCLSKYYSDPAVTSPAIQDNAHGLGGHICYVIPLKFVREPVPEGLGTRCEAKGSRLQRLCPCANGS
ncbi:hypothetical protein NDN08_007415 [Rhodosorus marinus]|uniref:Alpha-1,6-mannosyl-glycoprotein 6-beta-N-acetylglucosaminyltransferase n=1 Tax=Rhodosorus marinus TaxID=101924 RepID=A0AAV8V3B6_9RHOD|nr:hypothetical protein NDN08_007415 [Rhodosorus marinus]